MLIRKYIAIITGIFITVTLHAVPLQLVTAQHHVFPIASDGGEQYLLLCQTSTLEGNAAWHVPSYLGSRQSQLIDLFKYDTKNLVKVARSKLVRAHKPALLLQVAYVAGKMIRHQNLANGGQNRDWTWVSVNDLINAVQALKHDQKAIVRSAQGAWIYLHPELVALLKDPSISAALLQN